MYVKCLYHTVWIIPVDSDQKPKSGAGPKGFLYRSLIFNYLRHRST